jgi:excisionase family DNA binding protein
MTGVHGASPGIDSPVTSMEKTFPDTSGTQQSAHASLAWGNQPLFTLKQAAQYAICTPRYLQNQIRLGRLKALKPTGKLVRIRLRDLDAFLESGATIGDDV